VAVEGLPRRYLLLDLVAAGDITMLVDSSEFLNETRTMASAFILVFAGWAHDSIKIVQYNLGFFLSTIE
jgi:hypothetical protein